MRQRAGDDAELRERVIADQPAVALDIVRAVLQIAVRQARQVFMEPGAHLHRLAVRQPHRLFGHAVGTGHDPDAFGGLVEPVLRHEARAALLVAGLPARCDGPLAGGQRDRHPVRERNARVRIPACAARQVTALEPGEQRGRIGRAGRRVSRDRRQRAGIGHRQPLRRRSSGLECRCGKARGRCVGDRQPPAVDGDAGNVEQRVQHQVQRSGRRQFRPGLELPRRGIERQLDVQVRRGGPDGKRQQQQGPEQPLHAGLPGCTRPNAEPRPAARPAPWPRPHRPACDCAGRPPWESARHRRRRLRAIARR